MYNLDIPGWMDECDLKIIEKIAKKVPELGVVVEIGSFAGRSSWAWSKSISQKSLLYCIDRWDINAGISQKGLDTLDPHPEGFIPYDINNFRKNTKNCNNIIALQGFSPNDFVNWNKQVDVVFIDDDHRVDELNANLDFWYQHLKPNGIICGHDFRFGRYSHVVETILNFSKKIKKPLTCFGYSSVWIIDLSEEYYLDD